MVSKVAGRSAVVRPLPMPAPLDAAAERPCDLHFHSTCSDGLLPPARMMEEAAAAGLGLVSLTDHDTVEGIEEASARAGELGLELLPGIELTCRHRNRGTLHLLGYGIDPADPALRRSLEQARSERQSRLERICERLAALGVAVDAEAVRERAGGAPPGRPHVADELVALGRVSSRKEAFARWLGDGRPGDVRRPAPSPQEGIELVRGAGGLPVLAHPPQPAAALVEALARAGLGGLEVLHPSHAPGHVKILRSLASRFGLVETGGSDCHGDEQGLAELRAARVPAALGRGLSQRIGPRSPRAGDGRSTT